MKTDNTFIDFIAKKIWDNHGDELEDIIIIFPNNRAAYYLRKALSKWSEKPVFSPQIINYNQFIVDTSPLPLADILIQLDILYRCYCDFVEEPEPFDQFFFWGQVLLKDFSYVNNYLLEPKQVFALIKDLKEIDEWGNYYESEQIEIIRRYWDIFLSLPEEKRARYVGTWQYLNALYDSFFNTLKSEKLITLDIQKKILSEILKSNDDEQIQSVLPQNCKKIYFCGFNHLSISDEVIIEALISKLDGEMIWDYAPWMIRKENPHEAGKYIRKYKGDKKFGKYFKKWENESYYIDNQPFSIKAIECNTQYSQINVLGNVLHKLFVEEKKKPDDTLIILPDPLILFSCLRKVPEIVNRINVSISFPLQNTPVFTLIKQIITLHNRVQITKKEQKVYYHHEALLKIIEHPILNESFDTDSVNAFKKEIVNQNRVYINRSKVLACNHKLLDLLLQSVDTFTDFCQYLKGIFTHILQSLSDEMTVQMIHYVLEHLNYLSSIFHKWDENNIDLKQFSKLFLSLVQSKHVPFMGYPLTGLQVMGILETRNLNYKHIIILNMNENTWPSTPIEKSVIPYSLKKGFGLPTQEDTDAEASYIFFRLIEKCETATLIYHSSIGAFSKGESSRFIKQIEIEKMYDNFSRASISQSYNIVCVRDIKVKLDEQNINTLLEHNFSASMIITYLICPFRFYLRYVEGIKEHKVIEEEYDARHTGNVFHEIMKELYSQYLNIFLSPKMFKEIKSNIAVSVDRHFYDIFKTTEIEHSGGNILIKEGISEQVEAMVSYDEGSNRLKFLQLENEFEGVASININGILHNIKLKAIIDRIDSKDGITRILDYKTGKDTNDFKSIEGLFGKKAKDTKAVFQLFFYAFIYRHQAGNSYRPLSLGVINTSELLKGDFNPCIVENKELLEVVSKEKIDEFEGYLVDLIQRMLETDIVQTDDIKSCEYCSFRSFCGR